MRPFLVSLMEEGMRRRQFIILLGGATAWPLTAPAQQPKQMRRIGVLIGQAKDDPQVRPRIAAFIDTLRALGWAEGETVRIDMRWGEGRADSIQQYAAELAALVPDAILASGSSAVGPLLQETREVPIIFVVVPDRIGAGFVENLAKPGGRATGFAMFDYSIGGKWLELLKEMSPSLKHVAVLRDPAIAAGPGSLALSNLWHRQSE